MTSPRLELRGITKRFGSVDALRGVDLEVEAGEVMALVGDNGAGKSTLVKIIAGVQAPDEGQVLVEGQAAIIRQPQDAVALGIETVYQDLALCDNLDVVANLYLGRELRQPARGPFARFTAVRRMASEATRVLGEISANLPAMGAPVGTLSGGQRQAIAVGRAVLWGSKLVLMDEPTAALGVQQTGMVYDLIRRLRDRGVSVLLISHNMVDVFAVADRITVLRLGQRAGVFSPATSSIEDVISAMTGADAVAAARRAHGQES